MGGRWRVAATRAVHTFYIGKLLLRCELFVFFFCSFSVCVSRLLLAPCPLPPAPHTLLLSSLRPLVFGSARDFFGAHQKAASDGGHRLPESQIRDNHRPPSAPDALADADAVADAVPVYSRRQYQLLQLAMSFVSNQLHLSLQQNACISKQHSIFIFTNMSQLFMEKPIPPKFIVFTPADKM